MIIPGDNLAAWIETQGLPVHRAAGIAWWEPAPGCLEPIAPIAAAQHSRLEAERHNISLLLDLTAKREARFAAADGEGSPLPWRVWTKKEPYCLPTADTDPVAAWQLRSTPAAPYVDLIQRHQAWSAVGRFVDQRLDSYLIACEDAGWIHEVECSHPDDSRGEDLRRFWQHRIRHSEEWLGLLHRPSRHQAGNTNLRWSKMERRGHRVIRALRALLA